MEPGRSEPGIVPSPPLPSRGARSRTPSISRPAQAPVPHIKIFLKLQQHQSILPKRYAYYLTVY